MSPGLDRPFEGHPTLAANGGSGPPGDPEERRGPGALEMTFPSLDDLFRMKRAGRPKDLEDLRYFGGLKGNA